MVVNHMTWSGGTGYGTSGSYFDADNLEFPGVPYGPSDFNCCFCADCDSHDCTIYDYNNRNEVWRIVYTAQASWYRSGDR